MFGVEVNFLAVILASVLTMILGYIWYLPRFFGNTWFRLANIDLRVLNSKTAMISAGLSLIFMAYALAFITTLLHRVSGNSFFIDALIAAFFVFIGFQGLRMFQLAAFNQRSYQETAIHIGNELMTAVVMGLTIGVMGQ